MTAVQVVLLLGALGLWGRAAQVQIAKGSSYAQRAREQRTERVELAAVRGTIYDRNGVPLVVTQERYHVGIAPRELEAPERDVVFIADELGVHVSRIRSRLTEPWIYFHGPYTSEQVQSLREVKGVHLEPELVRFRPDPNLARPILGAIGTTGTPGSGLERVLDSLLRGEPGSAVVLRDQYGRRYESPSRLSAFPERGHDVVLTIAAELQDIVERALEVAVSEFDASGGDIVLMNPKTGEVLAAASEGPNGSFTTGMFTGFFEPGSTAKPFSAVALLEQGLVDERDSVWGEEGAYELNGRLITDHEPSGWMDFDQVIEQSSNIGMAKFVQRLDPEAQYRALRRFGFGTMTGIEFPPESRGILKLPREWSGVTRTSIAMGYEVAVTALQLAQAYSAIANDGLLMQPTLVRSVRSPNGELVHRFSPQPVRQATSPAIARRIREMLRGVVYREGTGSTAALTTYEVAGKTGTARRAGPEGYVPGSYTSSFVSLFPAEDPQMVMVIKLDDPEGVYASVSAAPLTRSVLEQILAARTAALDRVSLSVSAEPQAVLPDEPVEPRVVSWPPEAPMSADGPRPVPDVSGMPLRDAVRTLHRAGFSVTAAGPGPAVGTLPETGVRIQAGSRVRVLTGNEF